MDVTDAASRTFYILKDSVSKYKCVSTVQAMDRYTRTTCQHFKEARVIAQIVELNLRIRNLESQLEKRASTSEVSELRNRISNLETKLEKKSE